jgi:hypothetical protein
MSLGRKGWAGLALAFIVAGCYQAYGIGAFGYGSAETRLDDDSREVWRLTSGQQLVGGRITATASFRSDNGHVAIVTSSGLSDTSLDERDIRTSITLEGSRGEGLDLDDVSGCTLTTDVLEVGAFAGSATCQTAPIGENAADVPWEFTWGALYYQTEDAFLPDDWPSELDMTPVQQ